MNGFEKVTEAKICKWIDEAEEQFFFISKTISTKIAVNVISLIKFTAHLPK